MAFSPEPPPSGQPRRELLRCMRWGAFVGVASSIPLAALIALWFRFPVPFAGYLSGPGAMLSAMFAVLFDGLIGGVVVQAALGAAGGRGIRT